MSLFNFNSPLISKLYKWVRRKFKLYFPVRNTGSEKRLQMFAKVNQNKFFSKQAAFEVFAGVVRKKAS